ncbi:NUDIX domain-containing protein [Arcobacteraceae bacterium]|nr:NUDIX domain-containing protein [Arcobacteraceae bacterium]
MCKIKAYGICLYKKNKLQTEVLLCKAVVSKNNWGYVKGVQEKNETNKETALREFHEEASILVSSKYLEEYFEQKNEEKDIGIYLVNYDNIRNKDKYFVNGELKKECLCPENSQIKFFDIKNMPKIKKKQRSLSSQIVNYLKKG